jgi:hypothetical protein
VDQRSRNAASLLLFAGLGLHARPVANTAEEARPGPEINVRIFNYAAVERSVFLKARQEAGRILRRSGVETKWIECAASTQSPERDPRCTARIRPNDLVVRILAREMTGFENGELGVALIPADGVFGSRASVFHNKVKEYGERWHASRGLLLGHVIAHEMGHLLLGAQSHSGAGIMLAPWNRKTIAMAGVGTLLFTAEQAKRMRAQIAKRMRTACVDAKKTGGPPGPPTPD